VDLFQYASGQNSGARGVAGDLSGNIFVFGQASDASGIAHWLVRKSTTGDPGTWTTVDDVSSAVARNMMFVPAAGLFTVGITSASKTQGEGWMVRRSLDGGASWTTVDLYKLPKVSGFWQTAAALGVSGDGQGRIYVVGGIKTVNGSGSVANLVGKWLVRASSDGGATWTNIDTFSYVAGRESSAWGAGKDALGNIVVVGRGTDAQGVPHWIVRRPNLQGAWQTVDDFQLVSGESANAFGVVTDAVGDLLVSGYGTDAKGVSHWIVRRF
jgi:hypothetical protein